MKEEKEELSFKLYGLPPRSLELVDVACRRPDLALTKVAKVCGISVGNLRKRIRAAYARLGVSGRVELVAKYGGILAEGG